MTHQPTPSGIRAGARPPSCYGVMLAAKCGRASGLVRAAAQALTARAPGHIAPALVPRRLMVRLRFLIPPIEVRHIAGHPDFLANALISLDYFGGDRVSSLISYPHWADRKSGGA